MRNRSTAPWFTLLALAFALIVAGHFSAEEEIVKGIPRVITVNGEPQLHDLNICQGCHFNWKRGKK